MKLYTECCENCQFWKANEGGESGICRKHPPTNTGTSGGFFFGGFGLVFGNTKTYWPETDKSDWCGDYLKSL